MAWCPHEVTFVFQSEHSQTLSKAGAGKPVMTSGVFILLACSMVGSMDHCVAATKSQQGEVASPWEKLPHSPDATYGVGEPWRATQCRTLHKRETDPVPGSGQGQGG